MKVTLQIWRQKSSQDKGRFVRYDLDGISPDGSFLETLDYLNEQLEAQGEEPVAFESDCREGICGTCGFMINGTAHGPLKAATACQVHMRSFDEGETIYVEPWRARAFPVVKDLVVDRSAFDRILRAGGYISVNTGAAPDANLIPIGKPTADRAMDAAQCIGCGACVAACPNGSASLFTAAKIAHLNLLPQGQPERDQRARAMVAQMDEEIFGSCTNVGECQEACPKEISISFIAQMNRDYLRAHFLSLQKTQGKVAAQ